LGLSSSAHWHNLLGERLIDKNTASQPKVILTFSATC